MKINESFVLRKIYGRVLLVPICTNEASNDPILLNNVAADIWDSATCEITHNDLLEIVADMYDLPQGSVERAAISNFIDSMMKMGLLVEG